MPFLSTAKEKAPKECLSTNLAYGFLKNHPFIQVVATVLPCTGAPQLASLPIALNKAAIFQQIQSFFPSFNKLDFSSSRQSFSRDPVLNRGSRSTLPSPRLNLRPFLGSICRDAN